MYIGIEDIKRFGQELISILDEYHAPPQRELLLDAVLFAYLLGLGHSVTRQHKVGKQKTKDQEELIFALAAQIQFF